LKAIRNRADTLNITTTTIDTQVLQSPETVVSQGALFEPATLYLARRAESYKNIAKTLKGLDINQLGENSLLLWLNQDAPSSALKTELQRLKAHIIPCYLPWPNDIPVVIHMFAHELGLKFTTDAINTLITTYGEDLSKLDNEIRRLSLIFPRSSSPLTTELLTPHLAMLREDEALKLDRLLLKKDFAHASLLLDQLLEKGEAPLSLLAILTSHCRNSLRYITAKKNGVPIAALPEATKMPAFVLKQYASSLSEQSNTTPYTMALGVCHDADVGLKSSGISPHISLGRIILALQH
jgi:DNA polymerase III delta subunit